MDERTLINAAIAVSSGAVGVLGSHFKLRGRVNTLEAAVKKMEDSQTAILEKVDGTREDVAFIRGKMERGD